jgi:hypothetical protein
MILLTDTTSYAALPVLGNNQFFAPSSLFSSAGWSYTGTLPSSLNAGFKAENIDDDFFGDSGTQYATGNRSVTSTTGVSPSYTLSFRGEFEQRDSEAWDNSILDQSKGVIQTDIDEVKFVAPGGTTTDEHPIPEGWRSLNGYANPIGSYAKFDQTFTLSRNFLESGESGCNATGSNTGCVFTGAYFKGGANLQANLQGYGSIENIVVGTQSVDIDAKANRVTTFKVNNDPIFSGEINGTASTFSLEEEKVKSVDFSFKGSFKDQSISVGANVQWDGKGDTSSFDASYVKNIVMPDYVNVGLASQYHVEVRDDPQLSAGVSGTDFYKASVLSSTGISAIDTFLLPVFQSVAASRLVVKEASLSGIKSDLQIPNGGFTGDYFTTLKFLLENDGSIGLTLNHLDFKLVDKDIPLFSFFDDVLALINKDINYAIPPLSTLALTFNVRVPESKLNLAVDFLEGNSLELAGSGAFGFYDVYGSRERNFSVTIPEPDTIFLFVLGLVLMLRLKQVSV